MVNTAKLDSILSSREVVLESIDDATSSRGMFQKSAKVSYHGLRYLRLSVQAGIESARVLKSTETSETKISQNAAHLERVNSRIEQAEADLLNAKLNDRMIVGTLCVAYHAVRSAGLSIQAVVIEAGIESEATLLEADIKAKQ